MLAIGRLLVRTIPFHRIARRMADRRGAPLRPARREQAGEIARVVAGVARVVPFRAMCLEQAIAAAAMLRRRRIVAAIHLGTARDDIEAGFAAHAWITVDDRVILGGPVDRYTPIARF